MAAVVVNSGRSGGMMERQMPQEPIMIYVGVESVTEYSNKVERLGGRVIKQKTDVPGYGWFAICTDTETTGLHYGRLTLRMLNEYTHNSATMTD